MAVRRSRPRHEDGGVKVVVIAHGSRGSIVAIAGGGGVVDSVGDDVVFELEIEIESSVVLERVLPVGFIFPIGVRIWRVLIVVGSVLRLLRGVKVINWRSSNSFSSQFARISARCS